MALALEKCGWLDKHLLQMFEGVCEAASCRRCDLCFVFAMSNGLGSNMVMAWMARLWWSGYTRLQLFNSSSDEHLVCSTDKTCISVAKKKKERIEADLVFFSICRIQTAIHHTTKVAYVMFTAGNNK